MLSPVGEYLSRLRRDFKTFFSEILINSFRMLPNETEQHVPHMIRVAHIHFCILQCVFCIFQIAYPVKQRHQNLIETIGIF